MDGYIRMLSKNVRRKLYEYVVDELGLRIIRGDYLPGNTLPNEDSLCKELHVSRGVLREAMKVLIRKGLLESRPKTGTMAITAGVRCPLGVGPPSIRPFINSLNRLKLSGLCSIL